MVSVPLQMDFKPRSLHAKSRHEQARVVLGYFSAVVQCNAYLADTNAAAWVRVVVGTPPCARVFLGAPVPGERETGPA